MKWISVIREKITAKHVQRSINWDFVLLKLNLAEITAAGSLWIYIEERTFWTSIWQKLHLRTLDTSCYEITVSSALATIRVTFYIEARQESNKVSHSRHTTNNWAAIVYRRTRDHTVHQDWRLCAKILVYKWIQDHSNTGDATLRYLHWIIDRLDGA